MPTAHYRDTCSRCIELEKQVSELRHELIARETGERQRLETLIEKLRHGEHGRFWTYQIKRRRWSNDHNWFDWYVGCFSVCFLGGFLVLDALGFYPTWLVFAACAVITIWTELTVVKTPVYVNVNEGGGNTTTVH